MSQILQPIVNSYADAFQSTTNVSSMRLNDDRDELLATSRRWLDSNWNSAVLRPIASETLVRVATAGGAFADDGSSALPKYIMNEIAKLS